MFEKKKGITNSSCFHRYTALCYSLNVGVTIGSVWFGEKANEPWRMNNYYIIEGNMHTSSTV